MVHASYDWILDGGYIPHWLLRVLTNMILKWRSWTPRKTLEQMTDERLRFVESRRELPIAIEINAANEQQYEVSSGLFTAFMGPNMKYSCGLFSSGKETLGEAETAMLNEYLIRADLKDDMDILDLGCGWGSAALFFAEKLPNSMITGFSNSRSQKEYIETEARRRNLQNLTIITGDVAKYEFPAEAFDRVTSIELFEHMKNYDLLMSKIAHTLKPNGKLFVQIFCHRDTSYDFDEGWMARYFFKGGTMPSADLLLYFQGDLQVRNQWWVSGMHYSKTLHEWYLNLMRNRKEGWPYFVESYGEEARVWYNRWVVYLVSLTEFFKFGDGEVNGVSQYLFEKNKSH